MGYFLVFCGIITLLKGIALCQPYLTGPTPVVCPEKNETFVFTCRASQVSSLSWFAQSDYMYERFSENDRIQFFPGIDNVGRKDMRGAFIGKLVDIFNNVSNGTLTVADIVSTLTLSTNGISNETNIICATQKNPVVQELKSSVSLVLAEKPSPNTTLLKTGFGMFNSSYHDLIQFLATLFKGTAIDYYNISFSGAGERHYIVNTSENHSYPTWLQNITELNVTAHNCAGQSDTVIIYLIQGCDQPLPPMNGSVNNETTELGGRITFRCNDGFLPSEIMTAVCQTTGWSPDPALLECFPQEFDSNRRNTGIAIEVITIPVVVGTSGVVVITFVVVASIYKYVGRTKRKRHKFTNTIHTIENIRPTSGGNERLDAQPENSSPVPTYSYVQVPVVKVKPSIQQGNSEFYASVVHDNHHNSCQSEKIIGMYSEIGDISGPLSQAIPPPTADETMTHFHPDLLQCHDKSLPQLTPPPSNEGSEPDVDEPVKDEDVHPLDKTINGHIILLQLGSVRPYWRTLGSAAGVDEETLDMINADLTEDSDKLAEVVFRLMEQETSVTWARIAHLCELIGFHELSEALNKAYESGILPVEDDAEVSIPIRSEAEAPPLPPRDDQECDETGGSPPPPLPPPLSYDSMQEVVPYSNSVYPGPPPKPKPYKPSTN